MIEHRAVLRKWLAPGVLFAIGALLFALQSGLPAQTFFGGDSGVKLVAAQNALRQPTRPLDIDLPTIGARPVAYVEPFYEVHGDHMHAHTAAIFPVLTAPFLRSLGSRGVYVLPGIGLLGALAAWAWVARCLDARRSAALTILTAVAGAPWLFYGLEFWEHTPALALSGAGTGLFVRAASASGRRRWVRAIVSGMVLGVSALFRPETVCLAAGLLIASPLIVATNRASFLALTMGGIVMAVAPLAVYEPAAFWSLRRFPSGCQRWAHHARLAFVARHPLLDVVRSSVPVEHLARGASPGARMRAAPAAPPAPGTCVPGGHRARHGSAGCSHRAK